jgi:hypothetical protein
MIASARIVNVRGEIMCAGSEIVCVRGENISTFFRILRVGGNCVAGSNK